MCSSPPLICLGGATGTGKTALAIAIADAVDGVIINADSRQFYADFPIITAQPSAKERSLATHQLYGLLETQTKMDAGYFCEIASSAIQNALADNKVPILVGGTGLYFKALLQGLAEIPQIPQDIHKKWITAYQEQGPEAMHAMLKRVDPPLAGRIHPNDKQRITRALEVFESTGTSLSKWHEQTPVGKSYNVLFMGIHIPLGELELKLAQRIDIMLEQGAIAEAEAAFIKNKDKASPGWSGIGCAELFDYINGKCNIDECKAKWLKNTRRYAKRQITWFKKEKEILWLSPEETGKGVKKAEEFIQNWGNNADASS